MPEAKIMNERDTKLVKWLGEAHAKEAELEADLTAHISLTQKQSYKKRLQQHLKETRDHKRRVASRIKQLGGPTGQSLIGATGSAVGDVAGKTVAAVKGQVGAARALVTDQAETHLRNAQEELREEHVEIALYTRIEVFATEVGDRETAQLARSIRRDEERMAKFLTAELGRLVKDVVRSEIPRDQRATTRRRRSTASSSRARSTSSGTRSRSTSSASRSRSGTSSRASSSGSRPRSTARSAGSRSTSSRSTGSRSTGSRSTGSRSTAASRTRTSSGSSGARSRTTARS
jgi:ferritin-like metal-binding protein YciE